MTTRKTKPSRKAPASDNAGILRRFKKIISTLQDCYVAPGWQQTFDRKTAAKLVRYLERQAAGKRSYAPLDRELYNFLHAHGQRIDYLLMGRVNAMICRLASQSPAAQHRLLNSSNVHEKGINPPCLMHLQEKPISACRH